MSPAASTRRPVRSWAHTLLPKSGLEGRVALCTWLTHCRRFLCRRRTSPLPAPRPMLVARPNSGLCLCPDSHSLRRPGGRPRRSIAWRGAGGSRRWVSRGGLRARLQVGRMRGCLRVCGACRLVCCILMSGVCVCARVFVYVCFFCVCMCVCRRRLGVPAPFTLKI